ncbi:MAG TPA: hypothetical protein DCS97_09285 [Planctomycetes bacterium]|nr:hypothetical protein [Planctomycetota bacterium]
MSDLPRAIGKYEIRGELGIGGMGRVLLAYDPDLDREVAIKLLRTDRMQSARARERFLREARALARLSDPHVVAVHEFRPDLEPPCLVMELLRGRDLRAILAEDGPLAAAPLADLAVQALRGLAAAHAAGLCHRDIKPSNLMRCPGGVYKLLDFGLVEDAAEAALTDPGEVVGTRRYLAPERLSGMPATPSADLWALAATLCELGSAQHPFPNGRMDQPPLLDGVPEPVATWVRRQLAADPGRRSADASTALADLVGRLPDHPAEVQCQPVWPGETSRLTSSDPGSGSRITATMRPAQAAPPVAARLVRSGLPMWIRMTLAIWLIGSLATVAAGLAISQRAVEDQVARLRSELRSLAAGAALLIDPEAHLRLAQAPEGHPEDLAELRQALDRWRQANPEVRFVYTMAKRADTAATGMVQFICDASDAVDRDGDGVIGPDEAPAGPGQPYAVEDAPELLAGFDRSAADIEPTTDQWGAWLSGYAPIRTRAGVSTGLVGIDLPAGHVNALRRDFLWHSGILLGSSLIAFLAAGALVGLRLRRPVAELTRGMTAVAQGDYSVMVAVRSRDEFGVLATAYASMRDDLRRAAEVRVAFDAFVAGTLGGKRGGEAVVGARLACLVADGTTPRLAQLLEAVRAQGGMPEGISGQSVVIAFPARYAGDAPQERAVRAALAALGGGEGGGLMLGVALEATEAAALALENRSRGTDLLVAARAFVPLRAAFFADRLNGPAGEYYAVKGAVSA